MVPGTLTDNVTFTLCVVEVPVPTTFKVYVPTGVEVPTATFIVEPPPALTEAGVNEAVAPAGRPLTENATVWAAPLVRAVETA